MGFPAVTGVNLDPLLKRFSSNSENDLVDRLKTDAVRMSEFAGDCVLGIFWPGRFLKIVDHGHGCFVSQTCCYFVAAEIVGGDYHFFDYFI